jgi:hypothetical protein
VAAAAAAASPCVDLESGVVADARDRGRLHRLEAAGYNGIRPAPAVHLMTCITVHACSLPPVMRRQSAALKGEAKGMSTALF